MHAHRKSWLLLVIIAQTASSAAAEITIRRIDRATAPAEVAAVVVPSQMPLLHTAQILPIGADNTVAGDAAAQSAAVIAALVRNLGQYDLGLDAIAKLNLAAKDEAALEILQQKVTDALGDQGAAITCVISDLSHPDALVGLDAVAALPPPRDSTLSVITLGVVTRLPKPSEHPWGVLPSGRRVYVSGQAEPGDLPIATRKTMESLAKTLAAIELNKSAIVQIRAFVNPMSRAGEVRDEITKFFGDLPVPPLVLLDWKFETPIEIEVVAWAGLPKKGSQIHYVTPEGMKPSPVFSRVVVINSGPLIYVGGLNGPADASPDEQISDIFQQLESIVKESNSEMTLLAKATYFCTDADTIKSLGALRPKYYDPQRPPAASLTKLSRTGRPGTTITLDMIAVGAPRD